MGNKDIRHTKPRVTERVGVRQARLYARVGTLVRARNKRETTHTHTMIHTYIHTHSSSSIVAHTYIHTTVVVYNYTVVCIIIHTLHHTHTNV